MPYFYIKYIFDENPLPELLLLFYSIEPQMSAIHWFSFFFKGAVCMIEWSNSKYWRCFFHPAPRPQTLRMQVARLTTPTETSTHDDE